MDINSYFLVNIITAFATMGVIYCLIQAWRSLSKPYTYEREVSPHWIPPEHPTHYQQLKSWGVDEELPGWMAENDPRVQVTTFDSEGVIMDSKNCPIIEETGDGTPVGRCWFYLPDGHTCQRHGDVSLAVERYIKTRKLTHERDLLAARAANGSGGCDD